MNYQAGNQAILAGSRTIETSSSPGSHPPKPRLTLRVGVIGPWIEGEALSDACRAMVRRQFDAIFATIDEALAAIRANEPLYDDAPHKVRLVCGLIEEADGQAIASRPQSWDFDAILPFPETACHKHLEHLDPDHPTKIVRRFEHAREQATTLISLPEDRQAAHDKGPTDKTRRHAERRREKAHARSRQFLLGQIDVLIVVWDGSDDGRPGSIAQVVGHAIKARIPVALISILKASKNAFPRLVEDVDSDGVPIVASVNCLDGGLQDAIAEIVSLPRDFSLEDSIRGSADSASRERLEAFFAETWPQKARGKLYNWFKRFMQWRWPFRKIAFDYETDYRKPWTKCIDTSPEAGPLEGRIGTTLMQRYAWADALAVERSHRYRSAFMCSHFIAAGAVLVALLGVVFEPKVMDELTFKGVLVCFELLLAAWMFSMVWRGKHRRWHEKWMEYRALAEMLRGVRFLAYMGEHGQIQRTDRLDPASSAWFVWYLRATIREIGLPSANLSAKYQHTLLGVVGTHVIDDQLDYHRDNRKTLSRMHKCVHCGANFSFIFSWILLLAFVLSLSVANVATAVAKYEQRGPPAQSVPTAPGDTPKSTVPPDKIESANANEPTPAPAPSKKDVKHESNEKHESDVKDEKKGADAAARDVFALLTVISEKIKKTLHGLKEWLTFLVVLLAALGAALAGIREVGEFDSLAEHSGKTTIALEALKHDLGEAKRELTLDRTSDVLLRTAQVLTEDLGAWQSVYGRKQLNLT